MYFLIPRELREGLNFNKNVKCQKIEPEARKIFILFSQFECASFSLFEYFFKSSPASRFLLRLDRL